MTEDILVVDDESDIRSLVSGVLNDEGYATRQAYDATTAWDEISKRSPSLIILDIWLEGSRMDGVELLKKIKRHYQNMPVLMISGHGNIETAITAIKLGAYDFIEKPFKTDRLLLMVKRAIENARLQKENKELRLSAPQESELIGDSAAINNIRDAIKKVAPTGSRVMFTGPAGVGKEVAARLLHAHSKRNSGPFVVLNCATLRPENLEKELFGWEERNNNEVIQKIGLLEKAHGGTLLLDEITDMPLETQAKMVRVLQDQRFERINGTKSVEIDVRFIAASNKNLEERMQEGGFRQDLFYRLNVVPVTLPPLSNRIEDIPMLCSHFIAKLSEASGLKKFQFAEDALAVLQNYSWPGNIRQLRNVVEWILIMAKETANDHLIHADMLPPEIGASAPAVLSMEKGEQIMSLPLREAREVFEREYLNSQITRFGGNISRTANFIGMERSALHRKLKGLNVNTNEKRASSK